MKLSDITEENGWKFVYEVKIPISVFNYNRSNDAIAEDWVNHDKNIMIQISEDEDLTKIKGKAYRIADSKTNKCPDDWQEFD